MKDGFICRKKETFSTLEADTPTLKYLHFHLVRLGNPVNYFLYDLSVLGVGLL